MRQMEIQRLWLLPVLAWLATGCASGPKDPGIPEGAELLTELVSPPGERSGSVTPVEVGEDGALFVFDATANQLLYTGPLKAGDVVKLSWGGIILSGQLPTKTSYKPAYERQVARYEVGRRYRVYYKPGATAAAAATDEGSPLTKPFETQERTVNPLEGWKK